MSNPKDVFSLKTVGAGTSGELVAKPKASVGMNKMLKWAFVAAGLIFIGVLLASMDKIDQKQEEHLQNIAKDQATKKPDASLEGGVPKDLSSGKAAGIVGGSNVSVDDAAPAAPAGGAAAAGGGRPSGLPSDAGKQTPDAAAKGANERPNNLGGAAGGQGMGGTGAPGGGAGGLSQEQLAQQQYERDRELRKQGAWKEGLQVSQFKVQGDTATPANPMQAAVDALKAALPANGAAGMAPAQAMPLGDQDLKLKFLQEGGNAPKSMTTRFIEEESPYVLKATTAIPATLWWGINSDQPGMVKAIVRKNVYSTVHPDILLIPSSSWLIGTYDSRVAIGQTRNLVSWHTVQFPDGSELDARGLMTADLAGYAGLGADVDNHWIKLIGLTFGMSMISAAPQLVMPQTQSNTSSQSGQLSSAQIISASLTQQYGQLGAQYLGKYLQVQPTLTNEPGEKFNVILPVNIRFPGPWVPKQGWAR